MDGKTGLIKYIFPIVDPFDPDWPKPLETDNG